MRITYRD